MVDTNLAITNGIFISGVSGGKDAASLNDQPPSSVIKARYVGREKGVEVTREMLELSANDVETTVKTISPDTSISFRVEEDLGRMVVAVRAIGSDEIIRQFPPEEFITVAKHIAAQNPEVMDEDYLKGILFDQRT